MVGTTITLVLSDEYRDRFPFPVYDSFLSNDSVSDAHLVFHSYSKPSFDPELLCAPNREFPILQYTPASERYYQRGDNELFQLQPASLIIFQPVQNMMEVFTFDTSNIPYYFEGYIFRLLACVIAAKDGILLHGSGFMLSGVAGTVIGSSGAGKSTAVGLIDHDFLLSDDTVAVLDIERTPSLHSTPLGGATDGVMSAPLRALFFPKKGISFSIKPIPPKNAFLRYCAEHSEYINRLFKPYITMMFKNAHTLFHQVPAYELSFPIDYVDTEEIRQILLTPNPIDES